MPHITRLEDWTTWITVCALNRCPDETRHTLKHFVLARFVGLARKYAAISGADPGNAAASTPEDAWHLFETHLQLRHTREGKSYKQWLSHHRRLAPENPLPCLESGASLLIRDVVREHLRREAVRTSTRPLDAPVHSHAGNTYTLSDLLPAAETTLNAVHHSELTSLASQAAQLVFSRLNRRERLALLARTLNLPLTSPAVTQAAACRKSVLCTAYRDGLKIIADYVHKHFTTEDNATRAQLAIATFSQLRPLLVQWGKTEKPQPLFFMEENHDPTPAIQ